MLATQAPEDWLTLGASTTQETANGELPDELRKLRLLSAGGTSSAPVERTKSGNYAARRRKRAEESPSEPDRFRGEEDLPPAKSSTWSPWGWQETESEIESSSAGQQPVSHQGSGGSVGSGGGGALGNWQKASRLMRVARALTGSRRSLEHGGPAPRGVSEKDDTDEEENRKEEEEEREDSQELERVDRNRMDLLVVRRLVVAAMSKDASLQEVEEFFDSLRPLCRLKKAKRRVWVGALAKLRCNKKELAAAEQQAQTRIWEGLGPPSPRPAEKKKNGSTTRPAAVSSGGKSRARHLII